MWQPKCRLHLWNEDEKGINWVSWLRNSGRVSIDRLHYWKINQIVKDIENSMMCTAKCYRHPITYSSVYNDAYNASDRNTWLMNSLKTEMCCMRKRILTLTCISKAVSTQSIFHSVKRESMLALTKEIERVEKQRIMRIRYIQKKTLHHMYKPKGRMFCKSLNVFKNMLTSHR